MLVSIFLSGNGPHEVGDNSSCDGFDRHLLLQRHSDAHWQQLGAKNVMSAWVIWRLFTTQQQACFRGVKGITSRQEETSRPLISSKKFNRVKVCPVLAEVVRLSGCVCPVVFGRVRFCPVASGYNRTTGQGATETKNMPQLGELRNYHYATAFGLRHINTKSNTPRRLLHSLSVLPSIRRKLLRPQLLTQKTRNRRRQLLSSLHKS